MLQSDLITASEADQQDFCAITSRILIVSPRPASLRSLVAELALRCYDVLLLHHADDPLLNMVQGHIIVVDRTVELPPTMTAALPANGSSPVLALVSDLDAHVPEGEERVLWPGPIEEIYAVIERLAVKTSLDTTTEEKTGLVFKELRIDPERMTVTLGGDKVELTKTEYDLLRSIMAGKGKVMTRQSLMNEVWGESYFGGSNAVDVHIRSLRSKLRDDPKTPRYIATVRGVGYRLADE
ncbi:winged helix family transcriptional regulator [Cohnella endophytica]|uniref:Winged helix family transcriptional regulator n=1 Tax=Cohnella endophytica TaxID=2419778 RepID=A0A494XZW9_9BACL|nr:winged helix-turn-helix domain-containing protein [Cohnella endophytica]RKP53093.1 winged helix family transcriptional regulator [Cohnella endophytica]